MKKLFKRSFLMIISAAVVLSLAACNNDNSGNISGTENGQTISSSAEQSISTEDTVPAVVTAQYESMLDRQFSQYVDYVIHEDGQNVVIFADKQIKNTKAYSAEVDPETYEVKLGSMLLDEPAVISAEKALRIKVSIPEILPTTVISYDDADGTTKLFALSCSGEDGSVIKLDITDGKLF